MSQGKLVLVTGITGFIGGQVATAFLNAGYRVRGTTRGARAQQLSETVKIPGLEFAQVDDIKSSDLTEALKGVYAVIHVASPLPGQTDSENLLKGAEDGTLHIMRETVKAGIEKIVVTSSTATLKSPSVPFPGHPLNESNWGSVTKEQVKEFKIPFLVYSSSKIFAEKAVWAFAKEHPELDVATILPTFVYGPYAKDIYIPSRANVQLGTNGWIYSLIKGSKPPADIFTVCDVRDVAKAHVKALQIPRKPLEQKRYLVSAGNFPWKQVSAFLHEVRPSLQTLPPEEIDEPTDLAVLYDASKVQKELGINFIDMKDTILDAVDSLLEVEATWKV